MSGTTCAKTFSARASGTPTTISSRPARSLGAFLPTTRNASDQSAIANGHVSAFERVGISHHLTTPAGRRPCSPRLPLRLQPQLDQAADRLSAVDALGFPPIIDLPEKRRLPLRP